MDTIRAIHTHLDADRHPDGHPDDYTAARPMRTL
jgi:hypothetical protein